MYRLVPFILLNFLEKFFMGDHATFDIMDLYLLNLGTLVPKGPCCVFYATMRQTY